MWYLIPILILVPLFRTRWGKGFIGEKVVSLSNKFLLNKKKYHLINDVTLEVEGETTQVDHIVVSEFGVFVIETKNMSGWIFGTERQARWTQKIYRKSFRFQNPLRQNYKHIKVIETVAGLDIKDIHSIIVFVNGELKTKMPENVTTGMGHIRYIKKFKTPCLSEKEVADVIAKIETNRLPRGFRTNRRHVKQLRERHGELSKANAR